MNLKLTNAVSTFTQTLCALLFVFACAAAQASSSDLKANIWSSVDDPAVKQAYNGLVETFTAEFSNIAGDATTDATFSVALPTGTTNINVANVQCIGTVGGAVCPTNLAVSGTTLTGKLPSLPLGSTVTIQIPARLPVVGSSSLGYSATITQPAGGTELNSSTNTANGSFGILYRADLSVTKTQDVSSYVPGQTMRYTMVFTNNGPGAADLSTISDTLSLQRGALTTTFVSCSTNDPALVTCPTTATYFKNYSSADFTGTSISLFSSAQVPFWMPGGQMTVIYDVTYTKTSLCNYAASNLFNTASTSIRGSITDAVSNNNTSATTKLPLPANAACGTGSNLKVTKTASPSTYPGSGGDITYTVTYSNSAEGDRNDVRIYDTFTSSAPNSVWSATYIGCTTTGTAVCPADSALTYSGTNPYSGTGTVTLFDTKIPVFPAGSSITVTYKINSKFAFNASPVCGQAGGTLFNRAYIALSASDAVLEPTSPGTSDNSVQNTISIPNQPLCPNTDMKVTKTASPNDASAILAGLPTRYTMTYENLGPNASDNARIYDRFYMSADLSGRPYTFNFVSCTASGGVSCPASFANQSGLAPGGWTMLFDFNTPSFPSGGKLVIVYDLTFTIPPSSNCISSTNNNVYNSAQYGLAINLRDPNTANDYQSVTLGYNCTDLSIKKSSPGGTAGGGPLSFDLTITNTGPNPATNSVVKDVIASAGFLCFNGPVTGCSPVSGITPAPITVSCTSGAGGGACGTVSYDETTKTVSSTIPLLNVGQSVVIRISGTASFTPGSYANTATVQTGPTLRELSQATNSSQVNFSVVSAVLTKAFTPQAVAVGENSVLELTLKNPDAANAVNGIAFTDTLAPGLSVASPANVQSTCSGTVSASGSQVSVSGADLVKSGSCSIRVNVVSSAAGSYNNNKDHIAVNNGSLDTTNANAVLTVAAPIVRVSKTPVIPANTTTPVAPGSPVQFDIKVENLATIPTAIASGVRVFDDVAAGLINQTWSCTDAPCTQQSGNGALDQTITIGAGQSATYHINATAAANLPATITNTVQITPPSTGSCEANLCSSAVTLPAAPVIKVEKTTPATQIVPNGAMTYTATVTNVSSVDAHNVVIQDLVPTGIASFDSWSCEVAPAGAALSCPANSGSGALQNQTVSTFPAGTALIYTITAKANANPPAAVDNTLEVDPGTNGVCYQGKCNAQASVPPVPMVETTKTSPNAVVTPGGTLTYDILVKNTGSVSASGVIVSDTLPSGLTLQKWDCSSVQGGAVCPNPTGTNPLNETIATLPAGGILKYVLTVKADANPGNIPSPLKNVAQAKFPDGSKYVCTGGVQGPCQSEWSLTASPVVKLAKSVRGAVTAVTPGSTVVFDIEVRNSSTVAADGTRVQDTLPAGFASQTWECAGNGGAVCPNGNAGNGDIDQTISVLPAGGWLKYSITAIADQPLTKPSLTNLATLDMSGVPSGMCAEGVCSQQVTLPAAPVVSITEEALTPNVPVQPDGSTQFVVHVKNEGVVDAGGTHITVPTPTDTTQTWTCVSVPAAPDYCPGISGSNGIDATIPVLPPGVELRFTLTVKAGATPPLEITSTATLTPPTTGICTSTPCQGSATVKGTTAIRITKQIQETGSGRPMTFTGNFIFNATCDDGKTYSATVTLSNASQAEGQLIVPQGVTCDIVEDAMQLPTPTENYGWDAANSVTILHGVAPGGLAAFINQLKLLIVDPPAISKLGSLSNLSTREIDWQILVSNVGEHNRTLPPQPVTIEDPVPSAANFVVGSVTCIASDAGVTLNASDCHFDNPTNPTKVIVNATLPFGSSVTVKVKTTSALNVPEVLNVAKASFSGGNSAIFVTAEHGVSLPAAIPTLSESLKGGLIILMSVLGLYFQQRKQLFTLRRQTSQR